MLVTLNDVLPRAKKEKYAVGLFNTINLEMAKGVLAAAEETGSPVIIGTAEVLLPYTSLRDLATILVPMAKAASVPVVVHFDHGLNEYKVKEAISLGFSSVMYDCSTASYEENIERVHNMVAYAHAAGVTVEGELGHVGSNAGGEDNNIYTDPAQAKEFAEATGVDALAVAIGTSHGAYKSTPKLDFPRLRTISEMVEAPLVLHGGSGLSDDDFRNSVANGIAKINIFTDINMGYAMAVNEAYHALSNDGYTSLMPFATEAVKQIAKQKMELFGCTGKY